MPPHGSWQMLIILECKEDENIMDPGILLCLRESICLFTEPLWTAFICTFSGTVQQFSGMRLITRVFLGLFFCGTLILMFDPRAHFAANYDPEIPLVEIQQYQVHLPKEALAISSELRGTLRQNSATTQEEKEILRFYVSDASSLTSSDSSWSERSENGSTSKKKGQRKKSRKGDSANAEGASSSKLS